MPDLVNIWSFPYQHQLLIIRGRLESEGIESFTQDETTIQVDPLFSNAIGGIKLLVHAEDAERAIEILAENGFVKKKESNTTDVFLQSLDSLTGKLPLLNRLSFERRLFVLTTLGILIVAGFFYWLAT